MSECLEPGPVLQHQVWSVLVINPFHCVTLTGDIKQAFLQVRIREDGRDALRLIG